MDDVVAPSAVRAALARLDRTPSKTLGQNFLIDRNVRDAIVALAAVGPGDDVLEVGPGLGALTAALATRARRVVAVERDRALYDFLREATALDANVELVHGDILDVDLPALLATGIGLVVANLPYSVASRIVVDLVRAPAPPARIVVTVQKEVADRIVAPPATGNTGLLSLWAQARYTAAIDRVVGAACFHPRPRVRSAVVELRRRDEPLVPAAELPGFYAVTRAAFTHRRKQLAVILRSAAEGPRLGADDAKAMVERVVGNAAARPEELSIAHWRELAAALALTDRGPSE